MLVIGVALAALSFVAVLALGGLNQAPGQPNQAPDVPVVIAAGDIPLGSQISAEQLTTVTRPETEADDTYRHPEELVGKVARRAIGTGQAITTMDFETSLSVPELVRSLRPGLRAIALPLSAVDAVGALLQPGDYVDVLVSMREDDLLNPIVVPNPNAGGVGIDGSAAAPYLPLDDFINNTSIKVVVQNVQVLASIPAQQADDETVEEGVSPAPEMIVLLAVTPQQVEVVRFAQLDGNISLVLRSPADYAVGDVPTTGITLKELVDLYGVLPPQPVTP